MTVPQPKKKHRKGKARVKKRRIEKAVKSKAAKCKAREGRKKQAKHKRTKMKKSKIRRKVLRMSQEMSRSKLGVQEVLQAGVACTRYPQPKKKSATQRTSPTSQQARMGEGQKRKTLRKIGKEIV